MEVVVVELEHFLPLEVCLSSFSQEAHFELIVPLVLQALQASFFDLLLFYSSAQVDRKVSVTEIKIMLYKS